MTKLMRASYHANLKKMKALINQNVNPSAVIFRDQPHAGKPVLRYAIDSRSAEAVQLLIDAGADVNDMTESQIIAGGSANCRNITLLGYAIQQFAPLDVIQALILAPKIDLNKPAPCSDWTPLKIAKYYGNDEAVKLLLAATN